jgi:hypothetical protein
MKEKLTAIIVNDRGEVFTHWAMRVSFTPAGTELFYMVPQFAKAETLVMGEDQFAPEWRTRSKRRHFTINKPYVFSSRETAEKAMRKMRAMRVAVVT